MTHDGNNRRTRFQILFRILLLYNGLCHFRTDIFSLVSELFRHQIDGFSIQTLVDRHHDTDTHASSDDLRHGNIHHACQLVGSHEFRYLQHSAVRHFAVFLLLHTAVRYIALVLTVFGSLALTFGSEACQGFFYLLSYVFLANLLLDDRFLETIPVIVVTVVLVATLVITTTTGTLLTAACMRSFTSTTTVVASTLEVGCIVNIHLLLIIINAETFLLVGVGIGIFLLAILRFGVFATDFFDDRLFHQLLLILTNLLLLFALLTFLLFGFLLRACRLVQCRQINLTDDIDLRNKLRLVNCEDFRFTTLCRRFFCHGRFRLFPDRCRGSRCFFFYYFFRYYRSGVGCRFFCNDCWLRFFFHHRSRFGSRSRLRFRFRFRSELRLRFRFGLRFRFFLYHRRRCFHFLFFHFFYYRFPVQFIQVYFSDRFKLRTCIFGYNSLYFFNFRFLRSLSFVTIDRYRCFVTVFILPFLNETFRFKSKILICTELFHEQGILLLVNFCVGVCLNGKSFFLQELNDR